MFRNLALISVLLVPVFTKVAGPTVVPDPVASKDQGPLCSGCQFATNLIENQLKKFESVTKTDLAAFADAICAKAPKLEVVNTLCSNVKDDLIDIAVQVIEAIERQASGNVTCKILKLCS